MIPPLRTGSILARRCCSYCLASPNIHHFKQMPFPHRQQDYDDVFGDLASRLRSDDGENDSTDVSGVWEVRQENPPGAYLHLSRPNWNDDNMNGLHFEAYVLCQQLQRRQALVALHCESGWSVEFRKKFVPLIKRRIGGKLEEWNQNQGDNLGNWRLVQGDGMSICEVGVPFGGVPEETGRRIEKHLQRLKTLSATIDETINQCLNTDDEDELPLEFTPEQVRAKNGKNGEKLWVVIDGYVVDATDFANSHPGGISKILSTDSKRSGYTGKEFGFSLSKGRNAHFPRTAKIFEEAAKSFDSLQRHVTVEFDPDHAGSIVILGKLRP